MRFSLVVCTLGRTTQLAELFNSLLLQNRTDFEVILVDQNADNRLIEIVNQFGSSFPIKHVRQGGKGASAGRNAGLEYANGELIGFPDDDCRYLDGYLDIIHRLFAEELFLGCITGCPTDDSRKPINHIWKKQRMNLDKFSILDRCQEFTVFVRRQSLNNLRYNHYLGVGAPTLWGADEAPDLLIRLIATGVQIAYFPFLFVYHPNKTAAFDSSTLQRATSYSRGRGCLFRLHSFPARMILRSIVRSAIGCVLYLLLCKPRRALYYLNICVGILRGLLMSKGELDEVRKGWRSSGIPQILPFPLGQLPSTPLVSILIANHNYARFLPAALDSLFAQTYSHWQAIICDDGSTDDSVQVITKYSRADPRVEIICKTNGGQNSAYNACYEKVRGKIICFLDSDDLFDAHKLKRVVDEFHANPQAGMCNHLCQVIDTFGLIQRVKMQTFLDSGWLANSALYRGASVCVPTTSCMSMRREISDILFPVAASQERDLDGYLAMASQFLAPICTIHEKLSSYRVHGHNMGGITEPTPERLRYELDLIGCRSYNVKEFIKKRFGAITAAVITLEDNPQYIQAALKLLAIEGADQRLSRARGLIRRHPDAKWRAIWHVIFVVPKSWCSKAIPLMHKSYRIKAFVHRLLRNERIVAT